MRIGLINELHGRGGDAPNWNSTLERARLASRVGFDIFVFEDALMYRGDNDGQTQGVWESTTIAGALAASTTTIGLGHSVLNSVYRSPAMVASIATTLDEISNGRYVLGIGAGNTPESDYLGFGFPIDHRFARFAEAIQIIHPLLKTGRVNFQGRFYSAKEAELVLRGPSTTGPLINIAAGGPRMLSLAARYGDAWNWWTYDESPAEFDERCGPIFEMLGAALESEDRDPSRFRRTLDVYSVVAPGYQPVPGRSGMITGSNDEIADHILSFAKYDVTEVRCDVWPHHDDAITAMKPIVELVRGAD